jgi:hypothetical protein
MAPAANHLLAHLLKVVIRLDLEVVLQAHLLMKYFLVHLAIVLRQSASFL